jgi:hypothetical protein
VIIAGWASNSKYPFFSALRAAAQMVSYEVSIGFVLICVVLYAGTFNLTGIVDGAEGPYLRHLNGFGFNPLLFPMAVVFLISSMAETFRTPFDLVEAESELVAGHQTEYSSMSFALFWLGEYANVILMCALNAILFWGGWLPPIDWAPLYWIPGIVWLFAQDVLLLLRLRLGEGDRAALPLRPADAARLEDLPADGRIESVLLEGPAPFSSYTPAPGRKELLHKRDQWHGSFQKDAIRLRRTGIDRVDLVLEPKDGMAGAYSGFWTHVFTVEQRPIIVEGTIACRPVAGTSAGSGRP